MKFEVRAVTKFSAAHVLHGYAGACERIHGHNFEVELEVQRDTLDEVGMAFDFVQLRRMADEVSAGLDHRLLNDVPPFDTRNPTAENIGAYYLACLQAPVAGLGGRLAAVTVRETDFASVRVLP